MTPTKTVWEKEKIKPFLKKFYYFIMINMSSAMLWILTGLNFCRFVKTLSMALFSKKVDTNTIVFYETNIKKYSMKPNS